MGLNPEDHTLYHDFGTYQEEMYTHLNELRARDHELLLNDKLLTAAVNRGDFRGAAELIKKIQDLHTLEHHSSSSSQVKTGKP